MFKSSRFRAGRSGFTLIELLVVVAIIALLIAILLPSLARAREQAKAVQCGMQLNEIFKGIQIYITEYDGALVNFGENIIIEPPGSTEMGFWSEQILPYVKDARLYLCPSDQLPIWEYLTRAELVQHDGDNVWPDRSLQRGEPYRSSGTVTNSWGGAQNTRPGTEPSGSPEQITTQGNLYAPVSYIGNCVTYTDAGAGRVPRNISAFKFPAKFVMMGEGDRGDGGGFNTRSRCFHFVRHFCGTSTRLFDNYGWDRHNGKGNWLYMDGHTVLMRPQEIIQNTCEDIDIRNF